MAVQDAGLLYTDPPPNLILDVVGQLSMRVFLGP